ncbi:MAG: hypothetical protein Kow0081_3750 [Candidatus Dojkabacteria bacterium]
MEQLIKNFIEGFIDIISPADVDFSSPVGIFVYVLKIVLVLVIAGLTIYSLSNMRNFITFLRSTYSELKKVEWLSRAMTFRYSLIVIITIFLSTLLLIFFDETLLLLRNLLI